MDELSSTAAPVRLPGLRTSKKQRPLDFARAMTLRSCPSPRKRIPQYTASLRTASGNPLSLGHAVPTLEPSRATFMIHSFCRELDK